MDLIKYNLFHPLVLSCAFINGSVNLLSDQEVGITSRRSDNQDEQKLMGRNFVDRTKDRIDSFLKVRQKKSWYLLWLIADWLCISYLIVNSGICGFGNERLKLDWRRWNLMTDPFMLYRYSQTLHRIVAILLIEAFIFRVKYLSRSMSKNYRHRQYDEIMTYFESFKLTLRATLYVVGLTDAVRCRDKLYRRKYPSQVASHPLHLKSNCIKHRRDYCYESYNGNLCSINQSESTSSSSNNRREKRLFNFDDDFHEINYQLKFPKQLLKNGNIHLLDMATVRFLSHWCVFGHVLVIALEVAACRVGASVIYSNFQGSLEIFLKQHLISYFFGFITVMILLHQFFDCAPFIINCLVCYNKAKYTVKFAKRFNELCWYNKKITSSFTTTQNTRRSSITFHNYDIVGNGVFNDRTLIRKSLLEKHGCYAVNFVIEGDETEYSTYLAEQIDTLIRMIIEVRSDLDQLKKSFGLYLNLELIFKMPCLMLLLATRIKMTDLDDLQILMIYIMFPCFWCPILYISYIVGILHCKVSIMTKSGSWYFFMFADVDSLNTTISPFFYRFKLIIII